MDSSCNTLGSNCDVQPELRVQTPRGRAPLSESNAGSRTNFQDCRPDTPTTQLQALNRVSCVSSALHLVSSCGTFNPKKHGNRV